MTNNSLSTSTNPPQSSMPSGLSGGTSKRKNTPHVRLTVENIKALWLSEHRYLTTAGYLHLLLKAMAPPETPIRIKQKEFCEEFSISRPQFFRAKAILILEGLITEDSEEIVLIHHDAHAPDSQSQKRDSDSPQTQAGQDFQKPLTITTNTTLSPSTVGQNGGERVDQEESLPKPWREGSESGDLPGEFCDYVGGLYPVFKDNPRSKGRDYILKLEADPSKYEKLRGYWKDCQAQSAKATGGNPPPRKREGELPNPNLSPQEYYALVFGEGA